MRYFFMAEPIRAMEGDLLGVEIITHFASSPARPLHPEFVISSWDNSQKRRFLLDLLRTIAAKHGWFLRHGLFSLSFRIKIFAHYYTPCYLWSCRSLNIFHVKITP